MAFAYLVLYLLAAFQMLHSYEILPDRIATHFTRDGNADRWMTASGFVWFHFAFVFFISVTFWVLGYFVSKAPAKYISVPNKDYWITKKRLPEARAKLGNLVAAMGLVAGLGAIAIDALILSVNTESGATMTSSDFMPILIGMAIATTMLIVMGARSFRLPEKN